MSTIRAEGEEEEAEDLVGGATTTTTTTPGSHPHGGPTSTRHDNDDDQGDDRGSDNVDEGIDDDTSDDVDDDGGEISNVAVTDPSPERDVMGDDDDDDGGGGDDGGGPSGGGDGSILRASEKADRSEESENGGGSADEVNDNLNGDSDAAGATVLPLNDSTSARKKADKVGEKRNGTHDGKDDGVAGIAKTSEHPGDEKGFAAETRSVDHEGTANEHDEANKKDESPAFKPGVNVQPKPTLRLRIRTRAASGSKRKCDPPEQNISAASSASSTGATPSIPVVAAEDDGDDSAPSSESPPRYPPDNIDDDDDDDDDDQEENLPDGRWECHHCGKSNLPHKLRCACWKWRGGKKPSFSSNRSPPEETTESSSSAFGSGVGGVSSARAVTRRSAAKAAAAIEASAVAAPATDEENGDNDGMPCPQTIGNVAVAAPRNADRTDNDGYDSRGEPKDDADEDDDGGSADGDDDDHVPLSLLMVVGAAGSKSGADDKRGGKGSNGSPQPPVSADGRDLRRVSGRFRSGGGNVRDGRKKEVVHGEMLDEGDDDDDKEEEDVPSVVEEQSETPPITPLSDSETEEAPTAAADEGGGGVGSGRKKKKVRGGGRGRGRGRPPGRRRPKRHIANSPRAGGKVQRKQCPYCPQTCMNIGYAMHVRTCANKSDKYRGWKCAVCGNDDVYFFAPQMPVDNPNGPGMVCPTCVGQHAAVDDVDYTVAERVQDESEERRKPTYRQESRREKRRKVIAATSSKRSKESPIGAKGPSPANACTSFSGNNHLNSHPGASVLEVDMAAEEENAKMLEEQQHTASSSTPNSNDPGAVAAEPDKEESPAEEWSIEEECLLLMSALDDPQQLVRCGAGSWMLRIESDEEAAINGAHSHAMIIRHWETMLMRRKCDGGTPLANIPAQDRASHVLSSCIAADIPAARSIALISAGWSYIAPDIEESMSSTHKKTLPRRVSRHSNHDVTSRCRWRRPGDSVMVLSEQSVDDYVSSSRSLKEAWGLHMDELRAGIEEVLKAHQERAKPPVIVTSDVGHLETEGKEELEVVESNERDTATNMELDDQAEVIEDSPHAQGDRMCGYVKLRRKYVKEGDPRPSPVCSWCGPRSLLTPPPSSKDLVCSEESLRPSCIACKALRDAGWTFEAPLFQRIGGKITNVSRDCAFRDPDQHLYRSVKAFLIASTDYVVKNVTKYVPTHDDESDKNGTSSDDHDSVDQTVESTDDGDSIAGSETFFDETGTTGHSNVVRLPTITDLFSQDEGLMGVLKADEFQIFNSHYGSDANIALNILSCLATGKLPFAVQFETPFFRPHEELARLSPTGGSPPTRFIGVKRIVEQKEVFVPGAKPYTESRPSGKFGVALPVFVVKYEDKLEMFANEKNASVHESNEEAAQDEDIPELPRPATVGGRTVLLRADLREDVAGQLFSFMYRILYGKKAVDKVLFQTNATKNRGGFAIETLRAFGASERQNQPDIECT